MKKEFEKNSNKKISKKGEAILKYIKDVKAIAKNNQNISDNMMMPNYTVNSDKIYMYGVR